MYGMKKVIVFILAVLYMGSSTGATIHMHYCMGKLVNMGLWHKKGNGCPKCSSKKQTSKGCSKKCCKDAQKTIKLEKDQKTAQSFLKFADPTLVAIPINYHDLRQVEINSITQEFPVTNAPPRSSKVQTHILHCSFRI